MAKQSKLSDLETRRLRQEKELADLEQKKIDLEERISRKKEELEATNSNVIAEILVAHQLTMSEFLKQMPQMMEATTKSVPAKTPKVVQSTEKTGGNLSESI